MAEARAARDEAKRLLIAGADPSEVRKAEDRFPLLIYASLVEAEEGYSLIWFRSRTVD